MYDQSLKWVFLSTRYVVCLYHILDSQIFDDNRHHTFISHFSFRIINEDLSAGTTIP